MCFSDGAGRPRGQVLLLVAGRGRGAGSATARPPHTGSRLFLTAGGGRRRGRRPRHGAGARTTLGSRPQRAATSPASTHFSAAGARGQHRGDAAVATWGGRRPGDGPGPDGPRDHGPAGGMGGYQALLRKGSGLRGPDAGPPHLPGDAHPLRAGAMDDPDCAHPGTRASPGAGHLGERPPAPDDRALRARLARGPPAGLATTGGLVVMGSAGPDRADAPGAGAHAADPAQGAGQSALSCHVRAGGPPPGDLWRVGARGRRGGLSRGTPRSVHRAGGLPPTGLTGRGAVDDGPRARAQHARHVELPRLGLTAQG